MKNNIFIHADDFGYSENISKDILSCIDGGIVNSVSVMVYGNQEYYEKIKLSERKNHWLYFHYFNVVLSSLAILVICYSMKKKSEKDNVNEQEHVRLAGAV